MTVAAAQYLNRTKAIHLAFRLSDAALGLDIVCITISEGSTSIQLGSSADAAMVASRLGWTGEPVVEEYKGSVHHTWENDVDGIVVRIVGLDPIGGAAS